MAEVVLEDVWKIYPGDRGKEVIAVENANFTIADKEFIVLVGPSGCGKSTTLRMVAGLEEISRGSIYIDGKKMNDIPPKNRDIAMVFQNYALYPHMTVYKNMAFGLQLRKYDKAEIDKRVRDAASILGLSDEMLERKPKALSGGQRQRVAVGRAIVRHPKAFLFDEPLSNLDAKMRVGMRTEISKLHQRLAATMIYVTHDQVEAMTMGDRIVVMSRGRIMQIATPLELYNNPSNMFVAGFIGSPPMNFMEGQVTKEGGKLFFVEAGNPSTANKIEVPEKHISKLEGRVGKDVVLGVRPEDIHDKEAGTGDHLVAVLKATTEVIEPMGAETYVYLRSQDHGLTARLPGQNAQLKEGVSEFLLDLDKAHFFECNTKDGHENSKGEFDPETWQASNATLV